MRKIIPALLIAALVSACSSIDCPVENTVYTTYSLLKSDGSQDTLTDTLTIITFRADGSDSVVLNYGVSLTSFDLPISYTNPADTFLFCKKDTATGSVWEFDSVFVSKENYPHFESVDCQLSYFHTITGVRWTGNFIDSIVINKSSVNYDSSTEHFHLYLK